MEPSIVHQEVLSRSRDEGKTLARQQFYELRIEESDDIWHPGLVVKQIRAVWDEAAKEMKWEEPEFESWPTFRKAQERCEARRDALRTQGFRYGVVLGIIPANRLRLPKRMVPHRLEI